MRIRRIWIASERRYSKTYVVELDGRDIGRVMRDRAGTWQAWVPGVRGFVTHYPGPRKRQTAAYLLAESVL